MVKRVAILGAGVSGLTLGWRLAREGHSVEILEAADHLGGLSGTVHQDGYHLDYGPHSFFTEDNEMLDVFHDLFGSSAAQLTRRVKFYYQGKYLDYPLNAASILFQMGFWSGFRTCLSYLKQRILPKKSIQEGDGEELSVEDWAVSHFGGHLYRTFFKPYTEQFWKMSCAELSARSIPSHTRTSFLNTLKILLNKKATPKGSSLVEREKLPTYYPHTGYGELPDRIAMLAQKADVVLNLRSRATTVEQIQHGEWRVTFLRNGVEEVMETDHVCSTIPIPFFLQMLKPEPPQAALEAANQLDYRPLVVLGMVTKKQNILGDPMYIYQMHRPYNRLFETNKFSKRTSPDGENILAAEIPCQRDSVVWRASKEELFNICIKSLLEDGFLTLEEVKRLILVKAPYAYPIYKRNYAVHLEKVMAYINKTKGLSMLGRTGEYRYMDADQCMRRAYNLAENLKGVWNAEQTTSQSL